MELAEIVENLPEQDQAKVIDFVNELAAQNRAEFIRKKIEAAEESIAAGRTLSHEEVMAKMDAKIKALRA